MARPEPLRRWTSLDGRSVGSAVQAQVHGGVWTCRVSVHPADSHPSQSCWLQTRRFRWQGETTRSISAASTATTAVFPATGGMYVAWSSYLTSAKWRSLVGAGDGAASTSSLASDAGVRPYAGGSPLDSSRERDRGPL